MQPEFPNLNRLGELGPAKLFNISRGCKNVNILSEDKYLIFITTIVPELAKPISRFCTFETTLAGVIYETTDRVV